MRLSTETLPARVDENRSFLDRRAAQGDDTGGFVTDRQFAAQLRELLTTLSHGQALQRTPQRIVVTGVHTEKEASFLATSLAMTCAGSGYRVLLVDANFERPMVHRNLQLSNKLGVSSLLSSSDPPHTLPQATAFPNLAAITIGPPCPNLSSLLTREQLFHRLQPLAPSFDYMIVDCGALSPSLVARISGGADNVLIAVKEHVSSMKELSSIVETLRGEGVREPSVLMIE